MSISISQQYDGLFSPPIMDNSLDEYKYVEYQADQAVTSSDTNYKITIRDNDSWVALHQGYLKVKVHVEKQDGTFPVAGTDTVAIENNICNVFERAELRLGDTKVDQMEYVGLTSLIKSLPNISLDWKESNGGSILWYPDNGAVVNGTEFTTTAGEGFTARQSDYNDGFKARQDVTLASTAVQKTNCFMIPLRMLFPLLNDFRHPVKGIRSSIHFWKNNDVNSLCRTGTAGSANDYKLLIDDLSLFVPALVPTLAKGVELDTKFAQGMTIPIDWNRCESILSTPFTANTSAQNYRLATLAEKPTRIHIGFQLVARQNGADQKTISQVFDNLDLEYINVKINSKQYPDEQFAPDFDTNDYVREYLEFTAKNNFDLTTGNSVPYEKWETTYPIYSIDCENIPESVFSVGSTADIVVRFKLRSSPATQYHMVAVVESEAHVDLNPVSAERVKLVN